MIKFSDVYVTTLACGLCQPGEQFVSASAASQQSFWTLRIPFFRHDLLLIATTERLIVLDHRKGLIFDRLDRVASHSWGSIGSIKLKGLLSKRIVVKDHTGRTIVSAKLPPLLLRPIAHNEPALRMLIATWEQRRQLAAAPGYDAMLPAQAAPQSFARPAAARAAMLPS